MDFIFDNIYILVLVAAAVAQWLNSQREAKKAEREEGENPVDVEEIFGPDFDFGEREDEAPRPAVPPPLPHREAAVPPPYFKSEEPVARPQVPRKRASDAPLPEVASAAQTELARQQELMERLRVLKESRPPQQAGDARATKAFMKRRGGAEAATVVVGSGLKARLRDPAELRRAIVMREILGPPVALKS